MVRFGRKRLDGVFVPKMETIYAFPARVRWQVSTVRAAVRATQQRSNTTTGPPPPSRKRARKSNSTNR